MGRLDGRVAIVTGAGRGLGRAHALCLAEHGAAVVINDLGSDLHGLGTDASPGQQVVDEIRAHGGQAVLSGHDVSSWDQAAAMLDLAVGTFGDLHVLVNNAGILRDRTLANMSEEEWDAVIRVHLKGHAAPTRAAVAYWRDRAKAGHSVKASVVHTTSAAGLAGNFGQANYVAAKLGVVGLSRAVVIEAARYGVRSNAISPTARTRISMASAGAEQIFAAADDATFDPLAPENVSPLVAWLAEADCAATGQIFHIYGSHITVSAMPPVVHRLHTHGRWTPEALDQAIPPHLVEPVDATDFFDDAFRATLAETSAPR